MPWSSSRSNRGSGDHLTRLRGLAGEKGYEAVPALRSDGWHLLDGNGHTVMAPDGTVTFTIHQAMEFLKRLAPPLAP
jgi:hypothetical protein